MTRLARRGAALAALALLTAAAPASAGWLVPTSLGTADAGSYPVDVRVNARGDAFAVALRADNRLVWRYRPAGGSWSEPDTVGGTVVTGLYSVPASAAIDGNGNVRIAWSEATTIRSAYKAAGDAVFDAPQTVSTGASSGDLRDPEIATNADGKTFLAWMDFGNMTGATVRWADASTLAGPLSGAGGLLTYNSSGYYPINVETDVSPNGTVGVAWTAGHNVGGFIAPVELLGTVRSPSQTDFSNPGQAPSLGNSGGTYVDRANYTVIAGSQGMTVAYGYDSRVVVATRSPTAWSIQPDLAPSCASPAVGGDADGDVVTLAWSCDQGAFGRVFSSTSDGVGGFTSPVQLRATGDASHEDRGKVRVASGTEGRALVLWYDEAVETAYVARRAAGAAAFGAATTWPDDDTTHVPVGLDGDALGDVVAAVGKTAGSTAQERSLTALFDPNEPTLSAGIPGTTKAGDAATFTADAAEPFSELDGLPKWDFGDGTTGAGNTVKHTFDKTGTYAIEVTVKDAGGNSTKRTGSITVGAADGGPGDGGGGGAGSDGGGDGSGNDSTAPVIALPKAIRRAGRVARVRLRCPATESRCSGQLVLVTRGAKPVVLAARSWKAAGGKRVAVRLRMKKANLRRLTRARGLAKLYLTASDAAGNKASTSKDVVVKKKQRKRRG